MDIPQVRKMWWMSIILLWFGLIQSCFGESDRLAVTTRDSKGWGWGDASSTFFDIALTALAFLSFGIFLLNLLLNALLFPTVAAAPVVTNTAGPILTMIGGGTGIVTGGRKTAMKTRRRGRRTPFIPEVDLVTANEQFVHFVISSIEAMIQKNECLPRILCDGNRQSRVLSTAYKILFPCFSISISSFGKIMGIHDDLPKYLDAIALGFQEVNCQSYFSKCS